MGGQQRRRRWQLASDRKPAAAAALCASLCAFLVLRASTRKPAERKGYARLASGSRRPGWLAGLCANVRAIRQLCKWAARATRHLGERAGPLRTFQPGCSLRKGCCSPALAVASPVGACASLAHSTLWRRSLSSPSQTSNFVCQQAELSQLGGGGGAL